MAIKSQPSIGGSYEDFQPSSNWIREDSVDTIVIYLPGFKKENLRVQIDSHGNLKISGERPLEDDNRFYRFRKEFRVPPNCNRNEITAKFYAGLLYVKLPKKIADISEEAQMKPTQEVQAGDNTGNERKPEREIDSAQTSFMGGVASKLSNHRKLVVGVVVILSVAIALGIYGAVKLRSSGRGGDDENEVFYNVINH
ncbi:hypothetical protein ACHQM5_013277 [Ranunculus cassubicifolius]